jgi:hypothetical protein
MQSGLDAISTSRGLHRLIYASRQRLPAADVEHEVADLIRASIRNNRLVSVTGLLLVHGGWFIQALEGPAEAVMTTYNRICNDPRHTDSTVLEAGPTAAREFGDWNMCARSFSAADDEILDTLGQRQAFEPTKLDGRSALRLLKAVRGIQDRVARGG